MRFWTKYGATQNLGHRLGHQFWGTRGKCAACGPEDALMNYSPVVAATPALCRQLKIEQMDGNMSSEVKMSMKGKPTGSSPKVWQEKVQADFHVRRPRSGVEYVQTLLDSSLPPEIFLTENEQHTDIVVRFPSTSQRLPDEVRGVLFTADFTLAKAFDEVLRRFSDTDNKRTTRAELTRIAYSAFRSTWVHVFTTRYLHQLHPTTDEWLKASVERLKDSSNKKKGRPKESPSDRRSLERKYQEMLAIAIFFHDTAMKVVAEHPAGSVDEITKRIWENTRRDLSGKLYGERAAELVFSGAAFNDMAVTRGGVSLVKPSGWLPEELALTLLNLDEQNRYRMIKGRLTAVRSKKRAKSS